jgi:Caspase domain
VPGRRLALLVATYRYQDAGLRQLTAPGHDAEALAEVLRDPEIAGFDVTILINKPHHVVGDAIGEFYHDRRRDDLTLLYFTGHGLKDDHGRLYLAMTDTKRDRLLFTGLSAQQIDEAMESCLSRQKVLVLDCCYSGAFPAGRISKADAQVNTLERFQGKGRVVLTASDSTQYSFEGNHILGQGNQSVFTRFFVEGLITGKGDLDSDGNIALDELYSYAYDRVIEEMPQQRPKKQEDVEGRIVIAQNIHWSLPPHIRDAIESPFAQNRLTVLEGLAHLHRVGSDRVQTEVINQTRRLIDDDSKKVSTAALKLFTALNTEQTQPEAEEQARRNAEEQTRKAEEQARRNAEEQTRKAEEQARRNAEEQTRKAEEQTRKAEEQARRNAEEQTRKAEEQARRNAEEQNWKAEEQARRNAEEQNWKAEERAWRNAVEQAQRKAEEPRWVPTVTSSPRYSWAERNKEQIQRKIEKQKGEMTPTAVVIAIIAILVIPVIALLVILAVIGW